MSEYGTNNDYNGYDEYGMSAEVLAVISTQAAKIGAEVAIEKYRKEEKTHNPVRLQWLRTKKLLENYRDLKLIARKINIKPTKAEIEEFSFKYIQAMMEGREEKIDRIVEEEMNSSIRTYIQVQKIDGALATFRESCKRERNEELSRAYRAIENRYIKEEKKTVEEIAEMENVSTSTTNRDLRVGIDKIFVFLRPDLSFFD